MKTYKTLLFSFCLTLDILLTLPSQAQTTNTCDGCTISSAFTNLAGDVYSIIGTNSSLLTGANTTFFNEGTVQQVGSGGFLMGGYSEDVYFINEPGAAYQFASDSSIGTDYSPSYQTAVFTNAGLLWKSGGTNTSAISVSFNNEGGSITVDSGALVLNGGGSSSNGAFNIASGAVLDLTGGSGPTWSGEVTGSGAGTVSLAEGSISANPSLTLDFPSNLFQWDGGALQGIITNSSIVTISGTNASLLTGANTAFFNHGTVQQIGSGGFLMGGYSESVYFINEPGAAYQFASDSSIGTDYSPSYQTAVFTNAGLLWKSGGTNTSAISVSFDNQGGSIMVDSGILSLNGGGTSSNGTFNVGAGAVLDLTGGSGPTWSGEVTGSGSGTVSLAQGNVFATPSLTLDFPSNLFQWNGGTLQGVITNSAIVTISGTNVSTLTGANTTFVNHGTVRQIGSGGSLMGTYGANVYFDNEAGATYQFTSDSSIAWGLNFFGQEPASVPFLNQGLVWKSGGTNTSAISVSFNSQAGLVQVDSGTLVLNGGGTSSNGTFNVASGAVLDLTGGSGPTWAGQITGSGGGQVWLRSGTISASPSLVLSFPPNLFQWNGGTLQGIITNTGTVTLSGTNVSTLTGANSAFDNKGTVRQIGSGGSLMGSYGANVFFTNEPGATYEFASDSSLAWGLNFYGQLAPPFFNEGLIWKSAGTGTSSISLVFNNLGGSIEVDSGVLALNGNYAQGGGGLTITLGGQNTNQCGQLAVGGVASLGGPLKVVLANGYVPAPGQQFEILSSASFSGVFTSTNVPAGMTVSNLQNTLGLPEYVYLVATGALPGQFQPPQLSNGNLTVSFGTAAGQSYTVQQNTNLAATNWTFYTNIIGDGSLYQFATPVTNVPQRFFRLSAP